MISDSPIETLMSFLEHQCISNILTSSLTLARTPGSRAASWATGPHILKKIEVCLMFRLRCSCCFWSVVVVFLILLFLVHCCSVDIAFTLSLLLLIHCCPYLPSFTPFSSTTLMPQLNPHIFHTQNIPCVGERGSWVSLFSMRTIRTAVILGHSWAGS